MTGAGEVEERVKEAVEGVWVWLLGASTPFSIGVGATDELSRLSPVGVTAPDVTDPSDETPAWMNEDCSMVCVELLAGTPAIDGVAADEEGNAAPTEVVAGAPLKAGLALKEEGDTDWLPLPAGTPETSGGVVSEEGSWV